MAPTPPRWDLTQWFDDFGSTFDAWLDDCAERLDALDARFADIGPLTADRLDGWSAALTDLEATLLRLQHARVYAGARAATDTDDARASAAQARIERIAAAGEGTEARIIDALGAAPAADFEALCARPELADARHHLSRWRQRARRSMTPAQERLAAALSVDGISAWSRLYSRVTGGLRFELSGEPIPLAWLRGRLQDPDPATRAAALGNASAALASRGPTFAAALNGIAGARLTLDAARGLDDPLDEALFGAAIDRETLDAMMAVVAEKAGIARRFLRLKAKLLGRERLGWSDLRSPLGAAEPVPWPEARDLVVGAFERHHPDLAAFARMMFDAGRIEAEPRVGKRPGAFCTRSYLEGGSRVFMSFTGAAADIRTLAHELGHAFHNHVMRGMRVWTRQYPMTLAETASIVAETLVSDAQLADPDADRDQRLRVLDARLGQVVVYLLDIPVRLAFERAFYAERARGEVSVERLCALMRETQLEIFGDALDPAATHPWFWAEKLHFYIAGRRFYNFPYTFGYLFGQGVLARSRAVGPQAFHPTYVELLRATGSGTAEAVAADALGVDLHQRRFWRDALTGAEADLKAFEGLVAG